MESRKFTKIRGYTLDWWMCLGKQDVDTFCIEILPNKDQFIEVIKALSREEAIALILDYMELTDD